MVLKNDEKNFVIVSPALLCFGAAVVAFLLDLERIQVVSLYRQTQPHFHREAFAVVCF